MSYYEFHVAKRFVQFEGALKELSNYVTLVGRKILFLTACNPVRDEVVSKIKSGFTVSARQGMNEQLIADSPRYARYLSMTEQFDTNRSQLEYEFYDLGDVIVAEENIVKTANYIKNKQFDTVVGIGGGRGQDFARALTHYVPVKVILVPTLCATNASISTLSVLYSPDGAHIQKYLRMDNAPELVLVDTDLIVRNSPRTLSAGLGDIAATYYEALCNLRMSGKSNHIPVYSEEGIKLAIRILQENTPSAMQAIKTRTINQAFETVLSMIMHNPGPLGMICLTGYAHVIDEIFLYFEQAHATPHGLRVGFATIAMLAAQKAPKAELLTYLQFCHQAGIPLSLKDLGLDQFSPEEWLKAYYATVGISGSDKNLPFNTTADSIIHSLLEADSIVQSIQS